jgi:CDP-glycerol glycerophosphotransferase (TagB/SpsB family)
MSQTNPSMDFLQVWNLLAIAYPNYCREQSAETLAQTLKLYWQLLADLPIEQLKSAALRHVATSKFFPSVAELRDAAATLALTPAQTAVEAWGEVLAAMGDVRYYIYDDHYETPQFANPITNRLVRSMGWRDLCRSENAVADRARFTQAYEQLAARQRSEAALPETLQAGAHAPALSGPAAPTPQLPAEQPASHRITTLTSAIAASRRLA